MLLTSLICKQKSPVPDAAMFVIAELKDTIRVPPWSFKLKLQDTIRDEINRKLANKVSLRRSSGQIYFLN